MPIPQLSAAKSSLLGNIQIKTERFQASRMEARPRARNENTKKRPVRPVYTVILPAHFIHFIANIIFTWSVSMRIC